MEVAAISKPSMLSKCQKHLPSLTLPSGSESACPKKTLIDLSNHNVHTAIVEVQVQVQLRLRIVVCHFSGLEYSR
jgi:hypothetical protein